jgi:hypothetical protein
MATNITFKIANISDIDGVLALQELYLISNLSEDEKAAGFVTTPFTIAQLTEVVRAQNLFIAKDENRIIAYIFAGSWKFFSQWPIFNFMTALFPTLTFLNFDITTINSFQYGPICIHKEYRGQGLIKPLFESMRKHLLVKYPLSVTFINKINIPSLRAHTTTLTWSIIGEFQFNNNEYFILAYDMKKSVY